jgi:hypothetical protein
LVLVLSAVLGFGAMIERRTALRAQPMTDLGNPIFAAWAVYSGENLYTISEWHGWHEDERTEARHRDGRARSSEEPW